LRETSSTKELELEQYQEFRMQIPYSSVLAVDAIPDSRIIGCSIEVAAAMFLKAISWS